MPPLRFIFMGTPDLACASLRALMNWPGGRVVPVVTQPDRPKGRDLKLQPSPVKELALSASLPVLQPERARDEHFLEELRRFQPDLIAVAAFGQILPESLLALPRFGCLNVHTSLLPRYRGAAPIQWAILNGDAETGVTIMKIDAGLDTGGIVAQIRTPIGPKDTSETLHDRLAQIGAELLVRTLPDYVAGSIQPRPQPAEGVVHAPKIQKQDGRIDWARPARTIWNRVRGLMPWPGAFTFLPAQPQPHLLKIWQAEVVESSGAPGEILQADKAGIVVGCGQQALRVLMLQREGGRRLTAQQFLAGHTLARGDRLGSGCN
jgi:methionyl-tRNA formyltransferase